MTQCNVGVKGTCHPFRHPFEWYHRLEFYYRRSALSSSRWGENQGLADTSGRVETSAMTFRHGMLREFTGTTTYDHLTVALAFDEPEST
jgi:hypothetical protein